jgi:predicted metal-binding membrane protein
MNLLWVACISSFVLLEKIASGKQLLSRLGGLLFIGWEHGLFLARKA